eukprot:CFRG6606T1
MQYTMCTQRENQVLLNRTGLALRARQQGREEELRALSYSNIRHNVPSSIIEYGTNTSHLDTYWELKRWNGALSVDIVYTRRKEGFFAQVLFAHQIPGCDARANTNSDEVFHFVLMGQIDDIWYYVDTYAVKSNVLEVADLHKSPDEAMKAYLVGKKRSNSTYIPKAMDNTDLTGCLSLSRHSNKKTNRRSE